MQQMTMDTIVKDQKNRAFEAIARREAHELWLQQQKDKSKKRPHDEEKNRVESAVSSKDNPQAVALSAPTSKLPYKKGKYSFSTQTIPDAEGNHPIYLPLSYPVHENLARTNVEVNVVDKVLHELLQSGDSAQNYMQGSRRMKIDSRVHLDNRVQDRIMSGFAFDEALKSRSKRSKKHMSMKQHKRFGSLHLPQELHNFEMFKPMHEMWKGYVTQLLNSVGKSQMAQCLLGADLHGALILVAQCKVADFTGLSGIMIRETAETFGIITKDNRFRVVLKKISVFMLQVDCWKITLHGDKLTSRKVGQ